MSQSHLVVDFPMRAQPTPRRCPKSCPLMPDLAKAQDDLGTVHFSRFMVEGDKKLLFISDIDGEVDQHIERLVAGPGPGSTPSSSTWTTPPPRLSPITPTGWSNG